MERKQCFFIFSLTDRFGSRSYLKFNVYDFIVTRAYYVYKFMSKYYHYHIYILSL